MMKIRIDPKYKLTPHFISFFSFLISRLIHEYMSLGNFKKCLTANVAFKKYRYWKTQQILMVFPTANTDLAPLDFSLSRLIFLAHIFGKDLVKKCLFLVGNVFFFYNFHFLIKFTKFSMDAGRFTLYVLMLNRTPIFSLFHNMRMCNWMDSALLRI